MKTFRSRGPVAALSVFEKTFNRPSCQSDAMLQLNYAQALKAVVESAGNDVRACVAAEAFILVQGNRRLADAFRNVAAEGATDVMERCNAWVPQSIQRDVDGSARRAEQMEKRGNGWLAAVHWRVVLRMNPDHMAAHKALCRILPGIGFQSMGDVRCASWRALILESKPPETLEMAGSDRRTEWIYTSLALGAFVAGGVSYGFASGAHSDLLDANQRALRAIDARDEVAFQAASDERDALEATMNGFQYAGWGFLLAGGVLGGVAVYLWLDEDVEVSLTSDGSSAGVSFDW